MKKVFSEFKRDLGWSNRDYVGISVAMFLLVAFAYFGRPAYLGKVFPIPDWDLWPFAYRAGARLFFSVLLPILFILFFLKDKLKNYGFGFKFQKRYFKLVCLAVLLLVPVILGVSFLESFQKTYPFYKGASQSLGAFLTYELIQLVDFIAFESFFRGFLLFLLFKRFGYNSLFIAAIPCMMVHFGKPFLEVLASFPMAFILGYLALRAKSWWYGAIAHWFIVVLMDSFSILQIM